MWLLQQNFSLGKFAQGQISLAVALRHAENHSRHDSAHRVYYVSLHFSVLHLKKPAQKWIKNFFSRLNALFQGSEHDLKSSTSPNVLSDVWDSCFDKTNFGANNAHLTLASVTGIWELISVNVKISGCHPSHVSHNFDASLLCHSCLR